MFLAESPGVTKAFSPTLATTRPPCAKAASSRDARWVVYFSMGTESSSHGVALPGETILEKKQLPCVALGFRRSSTQAPTAAAEVQAPPRTRLAPPHPATRGPHSARLVGARGAKRSARSFHRGLLGRCPGGAGPARAATMVRRSVSRKRRACHSRAAPRGRTVLQPWLGRAGGTVPDSGFRLGTAGTERRVVSLKLFLLRGASLSRPRPPACCPRSWKV